MPSLYITVFYTANREVADKTYHRTYRDTGDRCQFSFRLVYGHLYYYDVCLPRMCRVGNNGTFEAIQIKLSIQI